MGGDGFTPVRHRGLIVLATMLAVGLQAVDSTIASVALPNMQGNLGAARDSITWVLTAYIVAGAMATPLTGWLAGRFGTKQVMAAAVVGFTVASLLCGIATSLPQVVLFRVIQGITGAPLIPLSQAVLLDVTPRERHGSAMALWSGVISGLQACGPTVGGWLTDTYGWRSVFLINLPVGLLAWLLIAGFMEAGQGRQAARRLDLFGFAMLALALAGFQLMLDRGEQQDWFGSREIVAYAVVAGLGLWMFLAHSFTTRHSFFSPSLLANRDYAAGAVLTFVTWVVFMGGISLTPLMLQQLYGYPPATAGLVTSPRALGMLIAMVVLGRLASRIDLRYLLLAGLLILSLSLYWMSGFNLEAPAGPFVWSGLVLGFGGACAVLALNVAPYATLPLELRAEATTFLSLVRGVAQSTGVSLTTTLLTQNTQIVHASLASRITATRDWPHTPFFGQYFFDHSRLALALNGAVNRQASMVAYVDDFYFLFWLSLAVLPMILLIRSPRRRVATAGGAAALVD